MPSVRFRALGALLALALVGCGDNRQPALDAASSGDVANATPDGATGDQAPDVATRCDRVPRPADGPRWVVVSHPSVASGVKGTRFEVLKLSAAGALSETGSTFELGTATSGHVVFTPDGEIGVAVVEPGRVGVFRIDGAGSVEVVHAAYAAKTFVSRVVMGARGEDLYLLSSQWREHGGGIYRARVGCDGRLRDETLVAAAKLPYALHELEGGRMVVVARDVLDSRTGDDLHLLDVNGSAAVVAGADAFGDDEASVEGTALTGDGRYVLMTDTSWGAGDRVAAAEVPGSGLRAAQVLHGLKDPADVVAAPAGNVALVLGGQDDSITVLDYRPGSGAEPFAVRGKLQASSPTLLPTAAVSIRRGNLSGLVLIAELSTIRLVRLGSDDSVEEQGVFTFGAGIPATIGAIGVQP